MSGSTETPVPGRIDWWPCRRWLADSAGWAQSGIGLLVLVLAFGLMILGIRILVFAASAFIIAGGLLALGAGLALLAVTGGYYLRLMQNVMAGAPQPRPAWQRWRGDFGSGVQMGLLLLLWALPALLLVIWVWGPLIREAILHIRQGPEYSFAIRLEPPQTLAEWWTGRDPVYSSWSLLALLCTMVFVWLQPGILAALARRQRWTDGLSIGDILRWSRRQAGPVLLALLLLGGQAGATALSVGLLFALGAAGRGLGTLLALWLLFLLGWQFAHIYGQIEVRDRHLHPASDAIQAGLSPGNTGRGF